MSALLSLLARVLFILVSTVFMLSLLAAGVMVALGWTLWELFHGRRPRWPTLHRFQGPWSRHPFWQAQAPWAQRGTQPGEAPRDDSVVEVVAREVSPRPGGATLEDRR